MMKKMTDRVITSGYFAATILSLHNQLLPNPNKLEYNFIGPDSTSNSILNVNLILTGLKKLLVLLVKSA